jgi:hypothetical protein
MHARGDRGQINSLTVHAQIIRPMRIHYTFVGDELTTTFGLFFLWVIASYHGRVKKPMQANPHKAEIVAIVNAKLVELSAGKL